MMPLSRAGSNPAPALYSITLHGQVPSGKNQVQMLWRNGKVHRYPNKTFTNWRAQSHTQILAQAEWGSRSIITTPVMLTVYYVPGDERTRDVSGQLDALFSLLVYAKVLKDDGLVHDVHWTRQKLNRKEPKLTMTIEGKG